jgi:predicted ATPase
MAKTSSTLKAPFLKRITLPQTAVPRDRYPLSIPLFKDGFELPLAHAITVIAGENGSGKSTLLEAIAHHCGFNIRGGNQNQGIAADADVDPLAKALRFAWLPRVNDGFFMRAESFFDFSTAIDRMAADPDAMIGKAAFSPYGGKSLHEQSHGEAFLALFNNRFGRPGLYILDEPEAALSPARQIRLLQILLALQQGGRSQIIMATHSPILMACPGAAFYFIESGGIREVDYRETPHFTITKQLVDNPEMFLASALKTNG